MSKWQKTTSDEINVYVRTFQNAYVVSITEILDPIRCGIMIELAPHMGNRCLHTEYIDEPADKAKARAMRLIKKNCKPSAMQFTEAVLERTWNL